MKKLLKNQKGISLVIVTLAMVSILGCAAIVTDVGLTAIQKQKLSNAIDAAALAAVQDITVSESNARETAVQYIEQNGFGEGDVEINISSPSKSVEIKGRNTVNFNFAKLLGYDSAQVYASAKAAVFPITGSSGVRPLAVEKFDFQFGSEYFLKQGAGGSYNGNFGAVALGGKGANNYRNNIKYGYGGLLRIGDWISTEPGNMSGPTQESIDYLMNQCTHTPKCTITHYDPSCPRVITVPIVNTLQVNGRGEVQISGFAKFLLKGTTGSGGHLQAVGWFIKGVQSGESSESGTDYGLYGARLIQ